MAVGAKNSTQFDKIGAINGVQEAKIGSLGPVDFLSISRAMTVSGVDSQYADGGSTLCDGGQWDVSSNAAWYITYPSILNGIISPTSGTGDASINAATALGVGFGTIDFYWTSDNAYAGYSFDVSSHNGGCV